MHICPLYNNTFNTLYYFKTIIFAIRNSYRTMNFSKKLIFLLILPLFAFTMHKYYISMTKIKYVQEERSVQVTMRFFIDDLEKTLNNRFKKEFNLATKEELKEADKFLNLYIHQKFGVVINKQKVEYTYLGKEYENDVVFLYMEGVDIDDISSIEVKNSMLMESFEEQQNYIKLFMNDQVKTMVLTRPNDKEMLKF